MDELLDWWLFGDPFEEDEENNEGTTEQETEG